MRAAEMSRVCIVAMLFVFLCVGGCSDTKQPPRPIAGAQSDLAAHTAEFKEEVIKVTEGVHVAVGFGLANSILLEGSDGVIIVDVMESHEAAIPVKEAFSKITDKPIKAIIYTHHHADHVFGGRVFAGDANPDVYAHETTAHYIDQILTVIRPIMYKRSMRQFGTLLPDEGLLNAGIGPRLKFDKSSTISIIRPTKTFSEERLDLEIAGLKLQLVHAPGETDDQIIIWLPEKKVLIPADNYYKSFPNLYAIRGTAYRDVMQWVRSLDKMRELRAEYLVPCHSRPLKGQAEIYETLTNYRDAIQYVHDQTIRGMNQGLTADELVERIKLPPHLAQMPYLQEYYGTVEWSVRAVFNGYLGWFSGNPTDLFPLPPKERAERFAGLAGGEDALLERASQAAKIGDHQWVLEMTDHLLRLNPQREEALNLRVAALEALAARQTSANARHYYLTQSLELQKKIEIGSTTTSKEIAHTIPLKAIFTSLAVNLDPAKSADVSRVVGFRFPDTGETYTVHVRRGVAEIQSGFSDNPDIAVSMDSTVWKEIVTKLRNPAMAYAKGEIKIDGGVLDLVKFLGLFKTD